jgi:hypothetical protein
MEDALLLSRWWLLLTAPACLAGIGLIVASVLFLLRTIRVPEFARLPLIAEQDVDLQDAGPLMFVIDKPRFSNVKASVFKPFALAVSLEDAAGRVVNADKTLMPMTVQGISRTSFDIATLASIEPARYRLRVAGLAPDVETTDSFLLITQPVVKWKMVAAILAIIASSALAIGGLIASLATVVKFQSG